LWQLAVLPPIARPTKTLMLCMLCASVRQHVDAGLGSAVDGEKERKTELAEVSPPLPPAETKLRPLHCSRRTALDCAAAAMSPPKTTSQKRNT
jgi:hypothetical protein